MTEINLTANMSECTLKRLESFLIAYGSVGKERK